MRTGQVLFKPKLISNSPEAAAKNGGKTVREQLDKKYVSEYLYRHGWLMDEKKKAKI